MLDPADEYDRIMEPVMGGDIQALEKLSNSESSFPDGQDRWLGRHWLTNAIDCGTAIVVRWMLEKGASPIYLDDEGYTALHSAIEREGADKYAMMAALIEFGADVNAIGLNFWTPAHMAAVRNDVEALRILYRAGADFSLRAGDRDETPLEESRRMGAAPDVIAYLGKISQSDENRPT